MTREAIGDATRFCQCWIQEHYESSERWFAEHPNVTKVTKTAIQVAGLFAGIIGVTAVVLTIIGVPLPFTAVGWLFLSSTQFIAGVTSIASCVEIFRKIIGISFQNDKTQPPMSRMKQTMCEIILLAALVMGSTTSILYLAEFGHHYYRFHPLLKTAWEGTILLVGPAIDLALSYRIFRTLKEKLFGDAASIHSPETNRYLEFAKTIAAFVIPSLLIFGTNWMFERTLNFGWRPIESSAILIGGALISACCAKLIDIAARGVHSPQSPIPVGK